jgi:hypothetical protein
MVAIEKAIFHNPPTRSGVVAKKRFSTRAVVLGPKTSLFTIGYDFGV